MLQRPAHGHVEGRAELGVVEADLHGLADLVHDAGAEVVAIGDHDRAGHPLDRVAHVVGDGGQAVPDDLVGQWIELRTGIVQHTVQHDLAEGVSLGERRAALGEPLGAGNGNGGHQETSSLVWVWRCGSRTTRLPSRSTVARVPGGSATVVVGASTTAGPSMR